MSPDDEAREKRTRVEAIWYRADSWDEARRFYRETIGLKEVYVDNAEGWAQFSTDAGPAVYVSRGGRPGQPPGSPVVGLRFVELETLHERLTRAGAEVDVRRGDSGITRLRFSDPEGHCFEAYRWELKDAVKPMAVRGVATDDTGRVLLVRVGSSWVLPGGVIDDYEGPLDALEREFLEEVGVRPIDPQLAGVYHSLPWDGLALIFHCRVDDEPRPGAEAEACEFVDVSRLAELTQRPWLVDRVLDVLEFPGRAVVRTQRTDPPKNYASPRSRPG